MAEGEIQFPGPVSYNEDDPKDGFVTLSLPIPGIKNRAFSKNPKNAEIVKDFRTNFIGIRVTVELSDHQEQVYEYRRRTIDDLDPQKSHFEVSKGMLKLHICKATKCSWSENRQRFINTENQDPL